MTPGPYDHWAIVRGTLLGDIWEDVEIEYLQPITPDDAITYTEACALLDREAVWA